MHDETPAIAYGEGTGTGREHLAEAEAEAAALIGIGDATRPLHVGALLTNSPAMLRAMAAAALGGYVLCGINTTRRGAGLLADIRRSDCQILLVDAEHLPLLEGLDLNGIQVFDVGSTRYAAAVSAAPELVAHREVTAADTLMMIFTSGTSGDPKAVRFAHGMAIMCGASLIFQYDVTAADVCYLAMPLFHSNGIAAGWAVAIGSGATMVPAKFSPSRFIDDVRRYNVTYLNYVGKPLALIRATPERSEGLPDVFQVRHVEAAHIVDEPRRRELGRDHGGAAADGHRPPGGDAVGVKQRHRQVADVGGGDVVLKDQAGPAHDRHPVREPDGLGITAGAGGEDHHQGVRCGD